MKIRGSEILLVLALALSSYRTAICTIFFSTIVSFDIDIFNQYSDVVMLILVCIMSILCVALDYNLIQNYRFCIDNLKMISRIYASLEAAAMNIIVIIAPLAILVYSILAFGITCFSIISIVVSVVYFVFNLISIIKSYILHNTGYIVSSSSKRCPPRGMIAIEYKIGKYVLYK